MTTLGELLWASSEVITIIGGTAWQFIPKKFPWFGGFWECPMGMTTSYYEKYPWKSG